MLVAALPNATEALQMVCFDANQAVALANFAGIPSALGLLSIFDEERVKGIVCVVACLDFLAIRS